MLTKWSHVIIFVRESYKEIRHPTFGGSRLIKELKRELEKDNMKVSIISFHDMDTVSSRLLRIEKNQTHNFKGMLIKNEKLKWFLSLVIALLAEIVTRFDFCLHLQIEEKMKKMKPDVVIYNGPAGASTVLNIVKKLNAQFILCEHNVDYYFYLDKLGALFAPLVYFLKIIEISVCNKSDAIICFNQKDKEKLIMNGVLSSKVIVWKFHKKPQIFSKDKYLDKLPLKIRNLVKKSPIVCFLGANYAPNIIAVKHILKIAKEIPNIIFLIVGSVGNMFKYERKNIPKNVIFTGYVEDIKPYLSVADVFLNLKLTSDTGIEAKMFDYLEYGKPILSTKIGTRGFEQYKNVLIVNNLNEMKKKLLELCGK